jgi:tetratricopeptide (TPR) repeat protein
VRSSTTSWAWWPSSSRLEQAEQYYQQALALKLEFGDRYSAASTYHNLGRVAEEQAQWRQALQYFLSALGIYAIAAQNDATAQENLGITLRSLARLWRVSGDSNVPAHVATTLGGSQVETEALLRELLPDDVRADAPQAPFHVTTDAGGHASAGVHVGVPETPVLSAHVASAEPSVRPDPASHRKVPAHPLIARGTAAGLLIVAASYGIALTAHTLLLAVLISGLALAAVLTLIACLDALHHRRWGWAVLIVVSTLVASVFIPGLGALLYGYVGPRRPPAGA